MQMLIRPIVAAIMTASLPLFAPAANAQAQSPSPGLSAPSADLSEQKLDAAAAAIVSVTNVKQDYQQRLAAAQPTEKEKIAGEAQNALEKAVTDQGLSVEEFTSILRVAQNDAGVREKILRRIKPSTE